MATIVDSYSESNQNAVYGILYGTGESTRAVVILLYYILK